MARVQFTLSHPNKDSNVLLSWTGLQLRIGTCTVSGGVLNWLTGAHGFVAGDVGLVAYFTPTGGAAGLYTITSVGSPTTMTATPVGFSANNVSNVACNVGDIGSPYSQPDAAIDRTLQVHGTFGASGNLGFFGSNDAANWYIASDNTGTQLNLSSIKVRNVFDGPLYYSPIVTNGDATTNLNALLALRIQLPRAMQ